MPPFERLAATDFCYLTTRGRVTGKPRTVELWFAREGTSLYILAGGREGANWVANLLRDRQVRIRVGSRAVAATARLVRTGSKEDALARRLVDEKYMGWHEGRKLSAWARDSLPIAIDLVSKR